MRFEIAKNDAAKASEDQEYELIVFQLPDRSGEGEEDYAAIRPNEELLLTLAQDVYLIQESPESAIDILNRIMVQAFNPNDLREALIEDGGYADEDGTGDGELSVAGLDLARSNARLSFRRASRRDPLGVETLASVAVWLVERWSGKDTGKPRDYLPPSSTTGRASKRTSSSRKGSTRSTSSGKSTSRGSSTLRTTG
jgi:hypothetical protein